MSSKLWIGFWLVALVVHFAAAVWLLRSTDPKFDPTMKTVFVILIVLNGVDVAGRAHDRWKRVEKSPR